GRRCFATSLSARGRHCRPGAWHPRLGPLLVLVAPPFLPARHQLPILWRDAVARAGVDAASGLSGGSAGGVGPVPLLAVEGHAATARETGTGSRLASASARSGGGLTLLPTMR